MVKCHSCGDVPYPEEKMYEVEPFKFYCEDCFIQYIIVNSTADDFAEAFEIPSRRAENVDE